ncbi:hypothetical protein [Aeromonas veronii]|uniref:hypothetical protein n=1 Tax=Aeromonas veronii TaxID=654 RepID=UPI002485DAC6|nr:hypothetical protein [Aeromonas veronii]
MGNLSVAEAKAVELKGMTSNVEDGQKVTLTVTDVNGKSVTFIATVTGGKFSTTVDLGASGLADGKFTGPARLDRPGKNLATDSENAILDSTALTCRALICRQLAMATCRWRKPRRLSSRARPATWKMVRKSP